MPDCGRKISAGALGAGFVLLFLFSSCSKVKGPYYGDGAGGPVPSESAIFPHPAGWGALEGHGKFVIDHGASQCSVGCHSGTETCAKCHASYPVEHAGAPWRQAGHGQFIRSAGNSTECATMCHRADVPAAMRLKGCSECHQSRPGPHDAADWRPAGHSQYLSIHGGVTQTDCVLCHGQRLEGKGSAVACTSCHHVGGAGTAAWGAAEEHGLAATNNLSKCLACHGGDLRGNAVIRGCDECHHQGWAVLSGMPWEDVSQHGARGNAPAATCKVCHGADLSGGAAGVRCTSCHEGVYPHVDNFQNGALHGPVAIVHATQCAACHPLSAHFCKTCHHDTVPAWLPIQHGAITLAGVEGCKACHGISLEGSPFAPACAQCHGPGMNLHQALIVSGTCCDPDDEDAPCNIPCSWSVPFLSESLHGAQAKANLNKCRICHGSDKKGGFSGKSCYSCHDPGNKHPHDPAALPLWQDVVNGVLKTSIAGRPWMNMITFCDTPCHEVIGMPGGIYGLDMNLTNGCADCHTW